MPSGMIPTWFNQVKDYHDDGLVYHDDYIFKDKIAVISPFSRYSTVFNVGTILPKYPKLGEMIFNINNDRLMVYNNNGWVPVQQ